MTQLTISLEKKGTRSCGSCTLCCKLVPVHEFVAIDGREMPGAFHKEAGERCPHQTFRGCAVYRQRGMPLCCQTWSCRWLLNDDTQELRRPDRAHYVIDVMPDSVREENGGEIPVVQVWIDPRHPEAHRDPALRDFLDRRGRDGVAAVIRYGATEGIVLIPPSMSGDGWIEKRGTSSPDYRGLLKRMTGR